MDLPLLLSGSPGSLLLTDGEPLLLTPSTPWVQQAAADAPYPPPASLAFGRVPGPPYDPERTMPAGWAGPTPYRPGAAA